MDIQQTELPLKQVMSVQTVLVNLLTLAALLLLCVTAAQTSWIWLAPEVEAPAPMAMQDNIDLKPAYSLFGSFRQTSILAAPTGIAIKLLGIVAASGEQTGYAVVRLEPGKILVLKEGQEFAPGIKLLEVDTASLLLERDGSRESLAWPKP